jgi:hypothetical protein
VLTNSDDAEAELHTKRLLSSAVQGCLLRIELPRRISRPVLERIKAAQGALIAERGSRNVPLMNVLPPC